MGFVDRTYYGYNINNTFSLGATKTYPYLGGWSNVILAFRYTNFKRASHDASFTLWWGRHALQEKISLVAYFVLWTENKNHGDAWTENQNGKKFSVLGEPQIWYNFNKLFSVGSEIKMFYHVYTFSENMLIYPTMALRYKF